MPTAITSFLQAIGPKSPNRPQVELARIDESLRVPCLLFFTAAVLWLLVGTVFAILASTTLHSPGWYPSWEWLTFGRIRSAHLNAMAYGWGNNAAFAIMVWIMARLSRTEVKHGGLLIIAGIFWNIGLAVGVFWMLQNGVTSVEWLEMPLFVGPLLAISYTMIGVWAVMSFYFRRSEHVYVSQWYILAAAFWFPWLYLVAEIMILWVPARGTVQAITNWWFGHNALGLWFTPIALSAAYYFIPKVLGRPIHSYYLSVLGFWSLALFYNWAGVHHLIGGPIPVWLISAGVVGSVMMVIPVIVTAINFHFTTVGCFLQVWHSPTLRFVVFGAMSYTLTSWIGSAMALPEVNVVTHFTHMTVGHAHHGVYAFMTMVFFGAMYFMMPRLLCREWPSAFLIRVHFWCVAVGITLMIVVLHVGGWIQGMEMNNAEIPFLEVMRRTVPWLQWRSVSGVLLAFGHIAFFINFMWMLCSTRKVELQEGPTMIGPLKPESSIQSV